MLLSVMTVQSVSATYWGAHEFDQIVAVSVPHSAYNSMTMTPLSPPTLSPQDACSHDSLQPAHSHHCSANKALGR